MACVRRAESLARPLRELGAEVLVQPAIEIVEPSDWRPVDAVLKRLDEFDWLLRVTVQAHLDLRGKVLLPIHWGKFNLSIHAWTEPIERRPSTGLDHRSQNWDRTGL